MDTISDGDDVHYIASIFSDGDPIWNNKNKSWVLKRDKALWLKHKPANLKWLPFMDSFSDLWHWSKTKLIFSLFMSGIICLIIQLNPWLITPAAIAWITAYIQVFNLYYNHKLKKQ